MYSSIRERLKTFSHFKVLYLSLMVVVSITSITFCIYFFKVFLDDYLTYPTVLKVDIDKGEQLTFPAVTICSHNRINSSKLKRLCSSEKNFNYSICEMVSSILGTYSYNMERFRHMNMSSTANICSNTYYRSEGVLLRVPDQEFLYLSLPEAQRERISFQAEEIIKDCLYEGHHCDARNFSKFWTFRNGNCFTFNSQWKKETRDQLVEGTGALTVFVSRSGRTAVEPMSITRTAFSNDHFN
ncbi:bile acid-sensitive ion channel-like isoform X2 [Tachypleus tridentatus]|uniref:bile acid-sensitive ion channel-like isoform X2 n=1 Tax=Tachypleus tridentatus TaxID=6853 RepID=UPI003FD37868